MRSSLHEAKAELFRTMGHPVRVRVLELLFARPMAVHELLSVIEVEASSLSQQLAVLRRAGLVSSVREGSTVRYTLATEDVADVMAAARRILTDLLSGREELLRELRDAASA
jgi:ArsR family transcriptional regulator